MKYYLIKDKNSFENLKIKIDGFVIHAKNKIKIKDIYLNELVIINKNMAYPYTSKIVKKKYKLLIESATDLLFNDDDDGTSINNVLNMIEKFRQEIKNKYRKYLKRKEIENMSKKLRFLKQQAETKQYELYNALLNNKNNKRSK